MGGFTLRDLNKAVNFLQNKLLPEISIVKFGRFYWMSTFEQHFFSFYAIFTVLLGALIRLYSHISYTFHI